MKNIADYAAKIAGVLGKEETHAVEISGWLQTPLPELNWLISGDCNLGFPQGRLIEIFGPSSSGKTFISTLAMKAVQEQGGMAFFADHERSFSPKFAATLGLNLDPNVFRHLRPRTFEDSIEAFISTVKGIRDAGVPREIPLLWVFDSVAAMIPRVKLQAEKGDRADVNFNMKDKLALATCCSQNYPILKTYAEDYNCGVLLLNQIRINPGQMFGDPVTTTGGKAAEFYADCRLSLGKKDVKDAEKNVTGFQITAKSIKNKISRPFRSAQWFVVFDEVMGAKIDQIATNVDYALRRGLLEMDNKRIVWDGKKFYASQLIKYLEETPDDMAKLMAMIVQGDGEAKVEIDDGTAE